MTPVGPTTTTVIKYDDDVSEIVPQRLEDQIIPSRRAMLFEMEAIMRPPVRGDFSIEILSNEDK